MKSLFLVLCCSLLLISTKAQTSPPCEVMADSLKGSYEGECSSGKANGQGKAVGAHTYEGNFKKGMPDGKGKYSWKDGSYYDGEWKKGVKEGKGEMYSIVNGIGTTIIGYWKKNNYIGVNKDPFIIHSKSSEVGRVEITKRGKGTEHFGSIEVNTEDLFGINMSPAPSGVSNRTQTVMTDVLLLEGNYINKVSNTQNNKDITTFQNVTFPIKLRCTYNNYYVEFEIFEKADWTIFVPINK